ncbi:MAG TPA: prolyl oligopeptidase family serine peptidase [Pseudonocardiaceae bacterium]|nr:prolyl oligopeptidase family serine peptidase [Pseudonocardiaceae bacterium]
MVKIAPYGTWTSPITAADVAATGGGPSWLDMHGTDIWWAESRPDESGRLALCRHQPGIGVSEVLGQPWNVRNRVHEYGGRPWTIIDTPDGTRLTFTNWADQRLYTTNPDNTDEPTPISPTPDQPHGWRYADLAAGPDGHTVWCVRETVTGEHPTDIRRDLVAVPLDGSATDDPTAIRVLAASHHFMTGPKPSPDGRHATWLGWNHPAMPWDGTQLCLAPLTDTGFGPHTVLTGGPTEAVCQVEWDSPDAVLALTDPDGWWNLHRITLDGTTHNLHPCQEELGGPLWRLGPRWFTPLGNRRYAILRTRGLAILDETAGTLTDITDLHPDWTYHSANLTAHNGVLATIAAGPRKETAVLRIDLGNDPGHDHGAIELTELTTQPADLPDPAYLPIPQVRTFTDPHGRPIPAFVYPPTNPDHAGPDGETPPFIVHVHGGPTGSSAPILDLGFSYFTSRGIGIVAVNYGGSVGYGRDFRERLREQWGLVDVHDCAAVATALAHEGTADGNRLAIRGGSAGGWTSAASLTSVEVYRCGTVMYPILDLTGWTAEGGQTHDFESRYVEGLVGTLPEHADRYAQRSPASHPDKVAGPVLMLQGLDDHICPPVQADDFIAALDGSGIQHAYLTFEGEQHGFRKAETIKAAYEAELSFYGQVLGFTTPGVPQLGLRR